MDRRSIGRHSARHPRLCHVARGQQPPAFGAGVGSGAAADRDRSDPHPGRRVGRAGREDGAGVPRGFSTAVTPSDRGDRLGGNPSPISFVGFVLYQRQRLGGGRGHAALSGTIASHRTGMVACGAPSRILRDQTDSDGRWAVVRRVPARWPHPDGDRRAVPRSLARQSVHGRLVRRGTPPLSRARDRRVLGARCHPAFRGQPVCAHHER